MGMSGLISAIIACAILSVIFGGKGDESASKFFSGIASLLFCGGIFALMLAALSYM